MIMEAVKRNVCRGVIFLMACLTCVVVFGSGLIAWADNYSSYVPYTTYACDLGINVTKTLTGREFQAGDEFTFKIEPTNKENNKVTGETVTIKATDNDGNPILTGNTAEADDRAIFIKFTWPGEYTYYISEDEPDENALPGIIYDQTEYKVTVTVSEKKAALDGSESEEATGQGGQTDNEGGSTKVPGSDNTANGEVNDSANAGSKNENDPIVDPSDPVENNITPADGVEENGLSGDGDNQSGGDDAQSKESVPKELEVTNVKVEKRSSSDGEWGTVVYNGPPLKDKQYCAFTNIYGTSVDLTGTKTLSGRDFQSDDTFTFTITPKDGAPTPVDDDGNPLAEVTIQPKSGTSEEINFGTIYFTPEVLGEGEKAKTFTYTITEERGSIDGMTYDTASRTVQIQVTREEDGSMTAKVVDPDSDELSWTNTWKDPDEPGDDPETPPEEPDEPDTPGDPVTPDEPDVPDTPDTPDEPNTPNEPTLPQTGQNWRLVWILAITGAVLVLVGILGKKGYHGKHEA